jgi:hypothetical protein
MKLVVLESPFAAFDEYTVEDNIEFARRCMRDCILKGEAPIASHLLYTQPGILDDEIPEERAIGIEAGLLWAAHAEEAVFYTDRGFSRGMKQALERHQREGRPVVLRTLVD